MCVCCVAYVCLEIALLFAFGHDVKGALALGVGVGNASNCRCNSVDLHDVIERWQMEIEIFVFVCPSFS